MRISPTFVASLFLTGLCACAGSGHQKVPMPAQNVAVSRADVCRIYVLRSSDARGSLRNIRVYDGDTEIGTIDSDEYLCWERPPGKSLVRLYYEGVGIGVGEQEGLLDHRGDAGQRYVYSIELSYPDRQPKWTLLSPQDANAILAERKPATAR
jgi:hypothetical protein